jgi:hypothetical protein
MKSLVWLLLLSSMVAESKTCPNDQKLIAAEFLKEEFYGRRLQAQSPCFKQSDFSWIKVAHDPPNEEVIKQFIVKTDTLKIDKVDLAQKKPAVYSAHFQVQVSQDQGKTWSNYQDQIRYMSDQNKAGRCALLLQSPQVMLIEARCLANDKD